MQNTNSMKAFWDFMVDVTSVISWIAKAAVAAPLLALVRGIGPSWPNTAAVAILTCLLEIGVLMYIFHFWPDEPGRRADRSLRAAFLFGLCSLVLYLVLFAFFTHPVPGTATRIVGGFRVQSDVLSAIAVGIYKDVEEALEACGYDALQVWVPWTVYCMRLVLLFAWLMFFAFLAVAIGGFARARTEPGESEKEEQVTPAVFGGPNSSASRP